MASIESKPRKGILKTSTSFDKPDLQPRSKAMKWDEMNILATHHPPDKDYGHMKIDEPKTPYSKYSEGEEEGESNEVARRGSFGAKDGMDPESLTSKLEGLEGGRRVRRVSTEEDDSSEEEDEELSPDDIKHKKDFELKRKLHYNEFEAVKLAKQLMAEEDDDDDDDDDESNKDSVQMVTDDASSDGQSLPQQRNLTETHVDSSGHLETQIN